MSQASENEIDQERRLEVIELELDEQGSRGRARVRGLVRLHRARAQKQWWHRFVNKRHQHVFDIRPGGVGQWTLFEPWWHRLLMATITSEQARKFLI